MKKFISVLIFLFVFFSSVYATELWFEDNNMGSHFGASSDFFSKFNDLNQWKKTIDCMDGYIIRGYWYDKVFNDDFIVNTLKKFLIQNKKYLIVNLVGINDFKQREKELQFLNKLKYEDIAPKYVLFQNSFVNKLDNIDEKYFNLIQYIKEIINLFPNNNINFIFHHPIPPNSNIVKMFEKKLDKFLYYIEKYNIKIDLILLDNLGAVNERLGGRNWETLIETLNLLKNKYRLKVGVIVTSPNGGKISNYMFYKQTIDAIKQLKNRQIYSKIDIFAFMAWFPYPNRTIPENCEIDYSMTCTLWGICQFIK